jgi:hypothetical protein
LINGVPSNNHPHPLFVNYLAPEVPRRDTITFYHAQVETRPGSLQSILVDHFWTADSTIEDMPPDVSEYRTCDARIWPAPGSPLELRRNLLIRPIFEEAVWAYLKATFTVAIMEQLRRMPYPQFLETQYWGLARALKIKAGDDRCERCRDRGPLDVHHMSYKHRGAEIWRLGDLKILCRACHMYYHHVSKGN